VPSPTDFFGGEVAFPPEQKSKREEQKKEIVDRERAGLIFGFDFLRLRRVSLNGGVDRFDVDHNGLFRSVFRSFRLFELFICTTPTTVGPSTQ
jgi:hypothetical protein